MELDDDFDMPLSRLEPNSTSKIIGYMEETHAALMKAIPVAPINLTIRLRHAGFNRTPSFYWEVEDFDNRDSKVWLGFTTKWDEMNAEWRDNKVPTYTASELLAALPQKLPAVTLNHAWGGKSSHYTDNNTNSEFATLIIEWESTNGFSVQYGVNKSTPLGFKLGDLNIHEAQRRIIGVGIDISSALADLLLKLNGEGIAEVSGSFDKMDAVPAARP